MLSPLPYWRYSHTNAVRAGSRLALSWLDVSMGFGEAPSRGAYRTYERALARITGLAITHRPDEDIFQSYMPPTWTMPGIGGGPS